MASSRRRAEPPEVGRPDPRPDKGPVGGRVDLETLIAVYRGRNRSEKARARMEALEAEIDAERARAYSRAHEKVQEALEAAAAAGRELGHAAADRIGPAVARYEEARERALRARWELRVHCEALGLRWTAELERRYPRPPRADRYRSAPSEGDAGSGSSMP
jgi:hypothetical protein